MGKNRRLLAFVTRGIIAVIYTASLASLVHSATNELVVPNDVGCICSGSVVTYECRIVGPGNTQWTGSLFDCVENGIVLRHGRFSSGGVVGECNQGAVTAQSIGVENNCYASQLSFTADVAFNNKTVVCIHNTIGNILIGMSVLTIIGDSYPPPENVILSSVRQHMLTFSWTPSATMCTSLVYNITSNCGSCPASSSTTTVNCTNVQVYSHESNCTFSVHSIVCGIIGQASVPGVLKFKVPDAPRVTIVPVYSSSNTLTRVSARINQTNFSNLTIKSGEIGIVDDYNIYVNNKLATNSSCLVDECEYLIDLPLDVCNRPADVSINISALNELGEGSASGPIYLGCRNEFVRLEYDPAMTTITCHFQGTLDDSMRSCFVQYGLCSNEQIPKKTVINSTTSNAVTLTLSIDGSGRDYCYTVTAVSGTRTVMIEGSTARNGQPSPLTPIVVPIVVVTIVFIVLLAVGIVIIIMNCQHLHGKKKSSDQEAKLAMESLSNVALQSKDLKPYKQAESEVVIVQYEVEADCSLGKFLETKGLTLKRGCVLCQSSKAESITENMLLLFTKTTGDRAEYFTLDKESDAYKQLLGDRVMKPTLNDYLVFFQSQDGGKRHLQGGTKILYMYTDLWPVERRKFVFVSPPICNTDLKMIGKRHDVDFSKHNFYFASESNTNEDLKSASNIILVNRNNMETQFLLTGTCARSVIHQQEFDRSRWRVYSLQEYEENMTVPRNTHVMYEVDVKHQTLATEVPLVYTPIHPERFERNQVPEKSCKLGEIRQIFELNPDEPVFIEIGGARLSDLDKDKIMDVIITDKEMQTWFTCPCCVNQFDALKKASSKKENNQLMVFIMCTSKESFQLPKQSWMLYNGWVKKNLWVPGLLPIRSHHFFCERVKENCTIKKIINERGLKNNCALFLESECVKNDTPVRDVILLEKSKDHLNEHYSTVGAVEKVESDVHLYTGPFARQSYTEIAGRRTVLVLCRENPSSPFTRKCHLYYERFPGAKSRFKVLTADEDNVRLSDFVEKKLKDTNKPFVFNGGKAFYEFSEEEDLLYFREIVVMKATGLFKKKYPTDGQIADCSYESFYNISKHTPGFGQKPSTEQNTRKFIQSMSQGSRCLKSGDTVLYKV